MLQDLWSYYRLPSIWKFKKQKQKNPQKTCFFQSDSSFIFNENDANYWVLTQDEFLFDELHTALQKT